VPLMNLWNCRPVPDAPGSPQAGPQSLRPSARRDVSGEAGPAFRTKRSRVEPDDLKSLRIIGAEHILNGADSYDDWKKAILADVRYVIEFVADGAGMDPPS